jgi:hypothetical protein
MLVKIELSKEDVQLLVVQELQRRLGEVTLQAGNVKIEVKSTQNYRSEWENADFRVSYTGNI